MIRRHGAGLRALLALADMAVAMALALALSIALFDPAEAFWEAVLPRPALALGMLVLGWVAILWLHGAYRLRARWSLKSDARLVLHAGAWMTVGTFAFLFLANLPDVSRRYLIIYFVLLFGATFLVRAGLRHAFGIVRRRGMNLRNLVVLGAGPSGRAFAEMVESHPELGIEVLGFLDDQEPTDLPARWTYLGPLDRLEEVVHSQVVDEVAICVVSDRRGLIESIAALCEAEGKLVRMPVPVPRVTIATTHVEDLDGMPVLSLLTGPHETIALAVKRALDLVGATVGLVVLAPLFAGIGLAIALTDGRPVLFRQERVGLNGRRFSVVKFRTMVRNADALVDELREKNEVNGHAFKMTADPRITRVGRFLRKSSLDELPQLWNVIRGEMSLVGPRPPLPVEVNGYDRWHRRRLSMKPGITGLWQIEGRNHPDFDQWVEKDLEYIDGWSPWLDIEILLRTIPAVLRSEGR